MTRVQTVLGPIPTAELGITLSHEHVFIDLVDVAYSPPVHRSATNGDDRVSIENLWWIRHDWTSSRDNLRLDETETALFELRRFRQAGGGSVVDATPRGLGGDPSRLAMVSQETGVHIIRGTGFYVGKAHPRRFTNADGAEVCDSILQDLLEGEGGVRSGVIGEIGCSWPLDPSEKVVLQAAARAQHTTAAPMILHPGRHPSAPVSLAEIIIDSGGDPTRTVIAHMDRTDVSDRDLTRLISLGFFVAYDLFGLETSFYPPHPSTAMPNDAARIQTILRLAGLGLLDHIVVSHDVCMKHRLASFGGHGYDHILTNVRPQMELLGASAKQIRELIEENPLRWLSGSSAAPA